MKKLLSLTLIVLVTFVIAACSQDVTVTFDSQGGSNVAAVTIPSGETISQPAAPSYSSNDGVVREFEGWFTDSSATSAFDFSSPVRDDLTLYAGWAENLVVSFNTKTAQSIPTVLIDVDGGTLNAPTPPTRVGYRFGGWFNGIAGLTWLEPEAVEFPLAVTESMTLNAYWEPVNSQAVNYSRAETYTSTLQSTTEVILNPFSYRWSHENTIMGNLSTSLYSTEVDWGKAINQGVADFIGDFSKIIAREYSIDALDFINIKIGATRFPVDADGEEHLTEDGLYNRDAASQIRSSEWTFFIREDLFFEDGLQITAETFEYTLKQYLDPTQLNRRSTIYYKTTANTSGYPILNAFEYFSGDVDWDEVGFEIINDFAFKITTFEDVTQSTALGMGDIRLVHPERYEASLTSDGGNSTYGTPIQPFVSYGPYLIKTWDENQRLVLNQNFEYVARETINYKSIVYEIVDNIDQSFQLFEQGLVSVVGLTQDYFAQYAENPNVYFSWSGFPQYMILNTRGSKRTTADAHVVPEIMLDKEFRQALFYGFDRGFYNNNVYAPNTPAIIHVPLDTKSYIQDPLYYTESPQYLSVLEEFNIDPETHAYYPDRAIALFDSAYARYLADGNSGPVTLKLAIVDSEIGRKLANYVKSSYEELFGSDRLVIELVINPDAAHNVILRDLEFDLVLTALGFGSSAGIWWQYPIIGGSAGIVYDSLGFGLTVPYDASSDTGFASYWTDVFDVDMSNTFAFLDSFETSELSENWLKWYEWLSEETDASGAVIKPAGVLRQNLESIIQGLTPTSGTPFAGTASEPFPGATTDTYNMVAGMQRLMMDFVNYVPTATRSDATLYSDNVVITWPAYSVAFGWGANRYRFLDTDSDFAEGLFNSFAQ